MHSSWTVFEIYFWVKGSKVKVTLTLYLKKTIIVMVFKTYIIYLKVLILNVSDFKVTFPLVFQLLRIVWIPLDVFTSISAVPRSGHHHQQGNKRRNEDMQTPHDWFHFPFKRKQYCPWISERSCTYCILMNIFF